MKSQTEFNWIFIIIAGAIILTFFVNFAFKFKSLQEERLSIDLLINLDNSLTNLQSSPFNTFDVIEIPKDVELTCNNIKIGNRNYENKNLIFSPKNLKNEIYLYYKPFNFPFKLENFYYIISPVNKYYLIANDDKSREFADSLKEDLPDKFKQNINIVATRKTDGKNIFINSNSGVALNDIKITLIQDKISLNYHKNYDDINKELIYGAIFSENANEFDCVYNKLKQNINKNLESYKSKAVLLQSSNCNYAPFLQYLSKLENLQYSDVKPIEALNQNLASQNCPVLY